MKGLTVVDGPGWFIGVSISVINGGTYPAASMLSLERGFRRRRQKKRRAAAAMRTARPPMIPPTIAPMGDDFLVVVLDPKSDPDWAGFGLPVGDIFDVDPALEALEVFDDCVLVGFDDELVVGVGPPDEVGGTELPGGGKGTRGSVSSCL